MATRSQYLQSAVVVKDKSWRFYVILDINHYEKPLSKEGKKKFFYCKFWGKVGEGGV